MALHELQHPAITICSQGLNQDDLNEAIKVQFERYALNVMDKNLTGHNYRIKRSANGVGTTIDAKSLWKQYVNTQYPGSQITPNSLVHMLIASNPDKVLRAKTLTNINSVCTNAIDCSTPIPPDYDCGCDCSDPALVPGICSLGHSVSDELFVPPVIKISEKKSTQP